MIHIRLPDGATRALAPQTTAADLAASISPSLAKRTVAAAVDGALADLSAPLPDGAAVELIPRDDPRALELIRHDLAHVLAEAVQSLWPGTRTAIGPAIEHGFYYDFEPRDALHPRRPAGDRRQDARDHRRAHALHPRGMEPRRGPRAFRSGE